jgi:hypothetical protein
MARSPFYDVGPVEQVAINLFHGWGYNFYRKENQLRADDQLVRTKAAWLLGLAHKSVDVAEGAFRREKIPAPSRAHPYPDPEAVRDVQALETLGRAIAAVISRLHALPTPENDRMTERYRNEAETLRRLGACDGQLIGKCELLRALVESRGYDQLLGDRDQLAEGLAAIEETLRERQALLV